MSLPPAGLSLGIGHGFAAVKWSAHALSGPQFLMRAAERCTAGSGPEVAPFQLQTSPASAAACAVNELTRTINAPKRTVKFVHHSLQKVTNHRPVFFATTANTHQGWWFEGLEAIPTP
jgi:hypothetical protein